MSTTAVRPARRLRRALAAGGLTVLFLGGSAAAAGAQEAPTNPGSGCTYCHETKDRPLPAPQPDPEPDTGESQPDDPDPRCDPKIESCP
jgi:hypothetical protein